MSHPTTPAAAPVAAPVAAPAAAPVAAAPVASAPAVTAAVPSAPPASRLRTAPEIGSISPGTGGGIPDAHFNKPILFRLLAVSPRMSRYERAEVMAPTVDYIVLDPATGSVEEVREITIMQKNIRTELTACYQRGMKAVTGVATTVPTSNDSPAKVLRALDDENSGYGAEQATAHLRTAAESFGWWGAAA